MLILPNDYRAAISSAVSEFRSLADSEQTAIARARLVTRGTRRHQAEGHIVAFRASDGEVITGDDPVDTTPTPLLRDLLAEINKPPGNYRAVWGYGSVFDVGYIFRDAYGPYVEVMNRNAFDKSLRKEGLQTSLLRSHSGLGLATTRANRMALGADDFGLGFAAYVNMDETDARDLVIKMESGSATTDTSVGGSIEASQWNDDYTELEIYDWSLSRGEISAVMSGANPAGWITLANDVPNHNSNNHGGSIDLAALQEVMQHRNLQIGDNNG